MKSANKILLTLLILLVIVSLNYYFSRSQQLAPHKQTPTPTSKVLAILTSTPNSQCHTDGILPDPACTPGAIDPAVTQENIYQTICVKGYTTTVRPPVGYTNALKKQQITAYGYTDTNLRDYEEDHLISLELVGNPTDPKNLWPEPGASPNAKDKIENLCHEKVCSSQLSLAEAQKEISANWTTACQ